MSGVFQLGNLAPLNDLGDSSWPLFCMYLKMKEKDDNKRAERQQKDADGIILFTGLFSAALAALITVSIQDLRPGPQDSSTFSSPRYAIWVNSLWFSSLAISLTSAFLATLLQQWTRRYIKLTQYLGNPHKRARTREFLYSGTDNLHLLLATDAVPTLLHLSIVLFFSGLLILLRNINHTVFDAVVVWIVLCFVIFAYITFLPIFEPASPLYAPLPSLAWQLYTKILCPAVAFLFHTWGDIQNTHQPVRLSERLSEYLLGRLARLLWFLAPPPPLIVRPPGHLEHLSRRLEEKIQERVSERSRELDVRILDSLIDALDEDDAREKFLEAIPDFYDSKIAHTPVKEDGNSHQKFVKKFRHTVDKFLDRTLSSNSISELVRSRRLLMCLVATQKVLGDLAGSSITDRIIRGKNWNVLLPSPEMGQILGHWRINSNESIGLIGSCIIAQIIASVGVHNETWTALTISQLKVTKKELDEYLKKGDSVLLANLINTTRLFLERGLQYRDILRSISDIDVKVALPELQQDFCCLWNDIVQSMQEGEKSFGDRVFILQQICPVFNAFHPTTPVIDAPLDKFIAENNNSIPPCPNPETHPALLPAAQTTGSLERTAPPTNAPRTGIYITILPHWHVLFERPPFPPPSSSGHSPSRAYPPQRSWTVPCVVPDHPSPLSPSTHRSFLW